MSPRLWLPVAVLGLAGGALVAVMTNQNASDDAGLTASSQAGVEGGEAASTVEDIAATADEAAGKLPSTDSSDADTYAQLSLTEVDRTVPEFSLPALDETLWEADTLKGKLWVVNFWATWCPPCVEEIPSMNAAYEVLEPLGIGMLAINAGEGAAAVESFLQKISIDFPNVLGDTNTLLNWSVRALPTTIVVDAEGRVIYEALGPREWDDEALLQRVIDLL